jgi:hypothetical protein
MNYRRYQYRFIFICQWTDDPASQDAGEKMNQQSELNEIARQGDPIWSSRKLFFNEGFGFIAWRLLLQMGMQFIDYSQLQG